MPRLYAEALGIVLTHELVRINSGAARREPVNRGGLAPWQQKRVAAYIEERVGQRHPARDPRRIGAAEPVPFLPVVQAFFGMPPHRYHAIRRIERPSSYWRIANCPSRRLRSMSASATRAGSVPRS